MKKLWLLMPLVIVAFFILHAETPDMIALQKLEANIKPGDIPRLYNGHVPVASDYVRYYTTATQHGKRVIFGEWVLPEFSRAKPAGIYPVASRLQFPMIADGGCYVVNIVYDVSANRILSLQCNGRA